MPRKTFRFLCLVLTSLATMSFSSVVRAADFEPDLQETLEWLAQGADQSAQPPAIPATAPELTRHPMPAATIRPLLDEIPGRPALVTDPPPTSKAYWKYPIYAVLGFPRDAVDSVFGFFSFWPVVNLPVVGVAYEIVPTQVFMRDPRDWHGYGGTRNSKGHGWIDSDSWGWFPTLNNTDFTYVSDKKLRKYEAHNEQLSAELQAMNKAIDAENSAAAERQRIARREAVTAIDAGRGEEAVSWMLPYHLSYPTDETAQALLINALAVHAETGPEWVRPYLWWTLSRAGLRPLVQAETLLTATLAQKPDRNGVVEAIVFIRTRLENYDGALETAAAAYQRKPSDMRLLRLAFETAVGARDATTSADALATLGTAGGDPTPLKLRQALLEDKAAEVRPQIAQLAVAAPDNPTYQFYLGCAELMLVEDSLTPEAGTQAALESLTRATNEATSPALRDRAGRALSFARALATEQEGLPEKEKKERGIINLRPGGIQ